MILVLIETLIAFDCLLLVYVVRLEHGHSDPSTSSKSIKEDHDTEPKNQKDSGIN